MIPESLRNRWILLASVAEALSKDESLSYSRRHWCEAVMRVADDMQQDLATEGQNLRDTG